MVTRIRSASAFFPARRAAALGVSRSNNDTLPRSPGAALTVPAEREQEREREGGHSEREAAEAAEATRANERAPRAPDEQLWEFFSVASHEIKTPLTAIKAYADLMARRLHVRSEVDVTDPAASMQALEETRDRVAHLQGQINRLYRLVEDLLDLSRMQAGKLTLRPICFDLMAVVGEAVEEQRLLWPTRHIAFDPRGIGPVVVCADPQRIGQVVVNYLTNALKYSPVDQPIEIWVELDRMTAGIWVRDHGPGIPAGEQELIWERFHQAAGITRPSGATTGLGLGLYITRMIVRESGGHVGVESVPGEGATFWCRLPVAYGAPG